MPGECGYFPSGRDSNRSGAGSAVPGAADPAFRLFPPLGLRPRCGNGRCCTSEWKWGSMSTNRSRDLRDVGRGAMGRCGKNSWGCWTRQSGLLRNSLLRIYFVDTSSMKPEIQMRKLSSRHRKVLAYRQRRASRFANRGNAFKANPKAGNPISIPSLGSTRKIRYTVAQGERSAVGRPLMPPEVFCFEENPAETLKFIGDFREVRLSEILSSRLDRRSGEHSGRDWIGVFTDLAAIRQITPAAALALAAEFDRAVEQKPRSFGQRGIVNAHQWAPEVASMLMDIGFFQILDTSFPDSQPFRVGSTNRKMLPMMKEDRTVPSEIVKLTKGLESVLHSSIDPDLGQAAYAGLIEAMDNCAAHAYPKNHNFKYPICSGRWWMSGSVLGDGELEVIFYDQGATIPQTLPHSGIAEKVVQWFHDNGIRSANDGQRIRAAMEVGRSEFDDQGRGHGLAQMRDLVDRASSGSLRILSGRGRYVYDKDAKEIADAFPHSIGGTLVHWRIHL